MIVAGLVLTGLAALVHVFIFYMESLSWTSPTTRATFGLTEDEAASTREMAFNQGFYNLFLALIVAAGIVAVALDHEGIGAALVISAAGSMAAAATVLFVSSPDKRAAALKQGVLPAAGVALLAVGLAL